MNRRFEWFAKEKNVHLDDRVGRVRRIQLEEDRRRDGPRYGLESGSREHGGRGKSAEVRSAYSAYPGLERLSPRSSMRAPDTRI